MSKIGIIQLCSKFDKGTIYNCTNFARFVHSSKLHGGYVLIQEGTVNATCPKIRNYSRKRKILKSIKLFYLFETYL